MEKRIKQYKKLVSRRIKWDQDHIKYQENKQARAAAAAMAPEDHVEEEEAVSEGAHKKKRMPIKYSRWPMSSELV